MEIGITKMQIFVRKSNTKIGFRLLGKLFFMKIMIKFSGQYIINVRYNRNRTHKPALGICLHNNYWSIFRRWHFHNPISPNSIQAHF
jgi:hypothetical protein